MHSLERALLVLSGLESEDEFLAYHVKVETVYHRFVDRCGDPCRLKRQSPPPYLQRDIAQRLFDYLWTSKPKRFGDTFLLTAVLDAQLSRDVHATVGTCVGLTCLYSVLGLRAGLNLSLLTSSSHLLSRLRVGRHTVDIDHTDPLGFDCGNTSKFREYPLPLLTANVLNSRGLMHEHCGSQSAARSDYEDAIRVNPEYPNAWNNRGNMKYLAGDTAGAVEDYSEAIRLEPGFVEAYCNRGMACQRMGFRERAREDYARAVRLDPDYSDAWRCLRVLENAKSGSRSIG